MRLVSWDEVFVFVDRLPVCRYYGVPRGGAVLVGIAAARRPDHIIPVLTPDEATVVLDDIIDSGRTRERFQGWDFVAMVTKTDPGDWVKFPWEHDQVEKDIEDTVVRQLQMIGEDASREGLRDTPKRYLKALREMTGGYAVKPEEVLGTSFSSEGYDEIVVVKDIEFTSLCEHHLLPFSGHVHFAYIPSDKIVGLSKIPRLVRAFAKRLQVQERLTKQIADTFEQVMNPKGVAVVVNGSHSCMSNRGIECQQGRMGTSVMKGLFKNDPMSRSEVLSLMGVT